MEDSAEFKQLKRDLLRYKYVSPNLSLTERLFLNDFWALFPDYVSWPAPTHGRDRSRDLRQPVRVSLLHILVADAPPARLPATPSSHVEDRYTQLGSLPTSSLSQD